MHRATDGLLGVDCPGAHGSTQSSLVHPRTGKDTARWSSVVPADGTPLEGCGGIGARSGTHAQGQMGDDEAGHAGHAGRGRQFDSIPPYLVPVRVPGSVVPICISASGRETNPKVEVAVGIEVGAGVAERSPAGSAREQTRRVNGGGVEPWGQLQPSPEVGPNSSSKPSDTFPGSRGEDLALASWDNVQHFIWPMFGHVSHDHVQHVSEALRSAEPVDLARRDEDGSAPPPWLCPAATTGKEPHRPERSQGFLEALHSNRSIKVVPGSTLGPH